MQENANETFNNEEYNYVKGNTHWMMGLTVDYKLLKKSTPYLRTKL